MTNSDTNIVWTCLGIRQCEEISWKSTFISFCFREWLFVLVGVSVLSESFGVYISGEGLEITMRYNLLAYCEFPGWARSSLALNIPWQVGSLLNELCHRQRQSDLVLQQAIIKTCDDDMCNFVIDNPCCFWWVQNFYGFYPLPLRLLQISRLS